MTTLTVTEDVRLSDLIDRVLGGDDVVISRAGRPVVALRPVATPPPSSEPKPLNEKSLAWLESYPRAGQAPNEDAGAFISRMRDEETHR